MNKKFKLKSYHPDSIEWKNIKLILNENIGKDNWVLDNVFYDFTGMHDFLYILAIYDYIPEKHDSIINELILRYG